MPVLSRPKIAPTTVLIVHSSDEMYGADRILLEVVDGLQDAGLRVVVWLPADAGDGGLSAELKEREIQFEHQDLPILRRTNLSVRGIGQLAGSAWKTLRALWGGRYPAVYLMTSACLPVAPLARLARTRFVVVHLQEIWSSGDRLVLRPLALFCSRAIAISDSAARASGLTRRPPVEVVENGVSVAEVAPLDDSHREPSADAGPHYLVASRWNAWKGHRTLLQAWELAGCPGTLTVLGAAPPVGAGVDVPVLVREIVSRPETVRVIGQVDSIDEYLNGADAIILPSDQPEPFGLVVIEAFGHGRPAIASRGGGPLQVITEGIDGWLFELGSASDLADLLRRLTPADLDAAGHRARETYLERYTPESYRRRVSHAVTSLWN